MRWVSGCSSCPRPATKIVTGRTPRRTCYSALTCDRCAAKHRKQAAKAGPVTEEPLPGGAQEALFQEHDIDNRTHPAPNPHPNSTRTNTRGTG